MNEAEKMALEILLNTAECELSDARSMISRGEYKRAAGRCQTAHYIAKDAEDELRKHFK